MNESALKTYKRWTSFRWLINSGSSFLDFFGNKYDERKVTKVQEASAIILLNKFKAIALDGTVSSLMVILKHVKDSNWSWKSDPLKGYFDYKSKPLMTVAKNSGDCDDFATLWCSLFSSLDRYAIFSEDVKSGHIVAVGKLNGSNNYVVVSNLELSGSYEVASPVDALLQFEKKWYSNNEKIHCVMKYTKKGLISEILVYPFK